MEHLIKYQLDISSVYPKDKPIGPHALGWAKVLTIYSFGWGGGVCWDREG